MRPITFFFFPLDRAVYTCNHLIIARICLFWCSACCIFSADWVIPSVMKFILIWFSCRVLVALLWRKRARLWFSVYTRSPWHQGSVTWSWRGWETTWLIKACRSSQHNGFHIFRFFCFLFVGFASTFLLWIWSGTGVLAQNNHVQMVRRKQGTIWCSKIDFFFFLGFLLFLICVFIHPAVCSYWVCCLFYGFAYPWIPSLLWYDKNECFCYKWNGFGFQSSPFVIIIVYPQ